MKKVLLPILLTLAALMPAQAQDAASHDNRLYISMGESENIARVPVTLRLENPSIGITAVEMYLVLTEGVTVVSSELGSRCSTTHDITSGATSSGYFVSVASDEVTDFAGTSGEICTLVCDFSALSDGSYEIKATGMFAVGVADGAVTSYTTDDQSELYTKTGDELTGLEEVSRDAGALRIYNLQGMRLAEPQKGQVNIINGKKVITEK